MALDERTDSLKGIGKKKAELLEKLGIFQVRDFLFYFPREYQDRRCITPVGKLQDKTDALIRAQVVMVTADRYTMRRKQMLRLLVCDETGSMEILFFNAHFLMKNFVQGVSYDFYGTVKREGGKTRMLHPEFRRSEDAPEGGILPVYPLTAGISQQEMRKWMGQACLAISEVAEYMPVDIMERSRLCGIGYALRNIHMPVDPQKLKEARFRLVFDELFFLQTGLLAARRSLEMEKGGIRFDAAIRTEPFTRRFPYRLTGAQQRVIGEVLADMESESSMSRLLQGDVGSGKTAAAEAAIYKAVKCGFQAVMMAPTEILAQQHFQSLRADFEPLGMGVALLSGHLAQKERAEVLASLQRGDIDILIGTHAVIGADVQFRKLGLVITDEQHRFGVNQRRKLAQKGDNPDVLIMTATPIPRTLAMILYGDLDISVIDELPPGRQPILTRALTERQRDTAYSCMEKEIAAGRQGYVVAPLIAESDHIDAASARSLYEELCGRFPSFRIELLHGGMKEAEKEGIMERFYAGDTDILVSTVVIEVGINVPNATCMIIENAERFGLAQLHQLRGRIGRGGAQSFCFLITCGGGEVAAQRAEILASSSDGFQIAEMDLKLRGPGEFFGTRQHGLPELRIADLARHQRVLDTVRREAEALLAADPFLSMPEHWALSEIISKKFEKTL